MVADPKVPVGRRAISAPGGAPAIGPYSSALAVGSLVFLSGQIPLAAAGTDFTAVARTTIYLADMADFAAVNEIYATYFSQPYPARATVQVARLPRDVRVEIDAIAVLA